MKLILKDGTEIPYITDSGYSDIYAEYETLEEVNAVIEILTDTSRLELVQFVDDEGIVISQYENLEYDSSEVRYSRDTKLYSCNFHLKPVDKNEQELRLIKAQMADMEHRIEELEKADDQITIILYMHPEAEYFDGTFVTSEFIDLTPTDPCYTVELFKDDIVTFSALRSKLPTQFYLVEETEGGTFLVDTYGEAQAVLVIELVDGVNTYEYHDVTYRIPTVLPES